MARSISEQREWGNSPEFRLLLWQFLSDCETGTVGPSEHDHDLACVFAGMFRRQFMELYIAKGATEAEADTAVRRVIAEQTVLHGSLAAEDQGHGHRTP